MSPLIAQQQALIRALFDSPSHDAMKIIADCAIDTGARGLKAYQANGHALARRALHAAYPVLSQLIGLESMDDLAPALWHAHPPQAGDLALWGSDLADFVAASPQLRDTPFLPDVARLEWALHHAAGALDAPPDAATLALLSTEDPDMLQLELAPGAALLCSPWPVVAIWAAHQSESAGFDAVHRLLQAGTGENAVVWRQGFKPQVRVALEGEADALAVLLQHGTLGAALDAAPGLDVAAWLPLAVQTGLLLAVRVVVPAAPSR